MAFDLTLPLRIAQFIFAIIIAGLSGYVFHWYDAETLTDPPSQINFLIAAATFTFISIIYLEVTSRFVPRISNTYVTFALTFINTIFYFAGFVTLATFLSKLLFCRGQVCAAARADAVFGAFAFALWAGSTALVAMEVLKSRTLDKKAAMAMKIERRHGPEATAAA